MQDWATDADRRTHARTMIIDSHAHFEPRMLDLDRVVAKMDASGVHKVALIPAMNDPLPHTPERLLAMMRRLMQSSLTRPLAELVHRATLNRDGNLRLSGRTFEIYPQPDNAPVAAAIAKYPDRFLGWIFLNPRNNPRVLDDLERWRHERGMIGVKLHPHWHDYRTDLLDPIFRRADELRLPVLIHLGFRSRGNHRDIARRFPRVTVIAAHAGFPLYNDLWRHRVECPNLYVDLSSPYIDESLARAAVAAMGPERCLYGTDAPYGFHDPRDGTYDYDEIKRWVERMPVSSAARERIFHANFSEILANAGRADPGSTAAAVLGGRLAQRV